MALSNAGHGLLILEVSRSHTHKDAAQFVGILWTSDQLLAETSTCQHTTLKYPCPRWDSNPRSQQASGRRPYTTRPVGPAVNTCKILQMYSYNQTSTHICTYIHTYKNTQIYSHAYVYKCIRTCIWLFIVIYIYVGRDSVVGIATY